MTNNPWLVRLRQGADFQLFCLSYAGGSSSVFRSWVDAAPPGVGLWAVELPGHGRRLTEPALTAMAEVVDRAMEAIQPELDGPFGFFGYSLGGMIAFELAMACRRRIGREPDCLVLAAATPESRAPQDQPEGETLIERLRRIGGTPPEILGNQEFMTLLAPTIEADFALIDSHRLTPDARLSCPILALAGEDDRLVTPEDNSAWFNRTSGEFAQVVLPGGHFFMRDNEHRLPNMFRFILERARPLAAGLAP